MSIDWSILHWVRDILTCPFLDFLMPKLTLLSNGGAGCWRQYWQRLRQGGWCRYAHRRAAS